MDENSVQKTEIPPKEIFNLMKKNIFDNFTHFSLLSINKDYLNSRKALLSLLHKITIKMGFKSQTFFLCAHFLDIIFIKKKRIHLNLNILGLSCLCLAAKYCENDPMVPHLQYFIKIFNNINGYKNAILMSELKKGEVVVLKILNYKLNYYTIYDFNSFLFGHGILKIEQLKEIENKNKKLYRSSRKKFVVNSTNSLMIKNILEKVYKRSRHYLDVIIKNTKLCFKYNPMFISIFIMKKSVEEVLSNERKINLCEKKEKEEFYEKNNQCFKQIMCDFYKINYEDNEQYKKILDDEEINEVFGVKKKNEVEGIEPAPLANKNINSKENNEDNNNKNLFINTYTGGFYNKIKLKEDNNNYIDINKRNIEMNKKSESNSEESKEEDDLEMNLNINEIQNAKNKKMNLNYNNSTAYNFYKDKENKDKLVENKYIISTNNREINSSSNKKNSSNNYNLTYSVEPYRNKIYISQNNIEKTSPLKISVNNNSNYTGIKKYVKIKGINTGLDKERANYSYNLNNNIDNNSSTNIMKNNYNYNTIKKYEKQPYFKKLISNDSNINSINRNGISSYYLTNSDINKNKVDINYRNTVNSTTMNTYNRIKAKNTRNKGIEDNQTYTDENIINNNKETQIISTTSSRYRKMIYRNKKEEIDNNISTEVKNANDFIIQDKNDNKKEIESYTQYNWNINLSNNKNSIVNKYKNNNIFIRKNKILNMDNNNRENNEDKKNLTSTNFYRNNININNQKRIIVNLLNSNKENTNNSFELSNKYSYNKNNINNEPEKKISVNTIENSNSQRVYQSIRHKYLNMKNKINNIPKINSNNSNELINDKNSRTSNYFYKKNINENKNNISNNQVKTKCGQNFDNKSRYKKFAEYSLHSIINKTKELFSKNNNTKEENKRITDDRRNNELNNNNINCNNNSTFYKSQQNFYQPKNKAEININNNNRKIVINNNININIGNKVNDYPKYKNIYIKNNVQPQTNSKNNIYNDNNINANNNKKNNNKVNKGINFSNILSKFQFYRKVINKNNK